MQPILLLADGSLTVRRVIELTFADENVRVIAVGDGGEAIARIKAEPPDIVLADIGMPTPDGYEVAEFVKRDPRLAHVPVLLLTGAFEPVDAARARSIGCDGVLVKPFEPQLVISRVRELLRDGGQRETAAPLELDRQPPRPIPPAGDEYFDRLDAAFAAMGGAPAAPENSTPAGITAPAEVGTAASTPRSGQSAAPSRSEPVSSPVAPRPSRLAGVALPAASAAAAPAPQPQPVSLAAAFSALLTAERGHVFSPGQVSAASLPSSVIDDIATRVIERIGDDVMRQAVLDVAERLVNEEIERIKSARQQGG
jgi:CheY-like chemotaxis protein